MLTRYYELLHEIKPEIHKNVDNISYSYSRHALNYLRLLTLKIGHIHIQNYHK